MQVAQRRFGDRSQQVRAWLSRALPLLVSSIFLFLTIGLTCQEYLDLPQSGESPIQTQTGNWTWGFWSVNYKGHVEYDTNYLGHISFGSGQLLNGAHWEVSAHQLTVGASRVTLNVLEPLGFDYIMSAKVELYEYDKEDEDWEEWTDEPLFGVSYNALQQGNVDRADNEECDPESGGLDPDDYEIICAVIADKIPANEAITSFHAQAPYGKLHMFLGVHPPDVCTGLLGLCDDATWTHRIP